MPRERILIAVKTYPVLSKKHIELACVAGFREDGSWVRIYHVPYRLLDGEKKFEKYQWVEIGLSHNKQDPRPESYRPNNIDDIQLLGKIGTEKSWDERRRLILERNKIFTNMKTLVDLSKSSDLSLAIFKPAKVLDFIVEETAREWNLEKLHAAEELLKQDSLFSDQDRSDFKIAKKLPYKFYYKFKDDAGQVSTMMIEDWEIGQLYWNCLKGTNEQQAIKKVKNKYFEELAKFKDIHFFLGTTREWHGRAPNPFIIIGLFYPDFVSQLRLI
jgi:hypothetical protein